MPSSYADTALCAVLRQTRRFVLDMDGTIYLGNHLFPFTRDFLSAVTESGRRYIFFTNNSSRRQSDYLDKLAALGLPQPPQNMLHANHVLLEWLLREHPECSVFLVGTPSLEQEFRDAGIRLVQDSPDIVVLGFDTTLTYEKLWKACDFVRAGCLYLGVNMDYNCPIEGGRFMPDCGSIAEAIRRSTGRMPEFFGKPSRHTLSYIEQKTGCPASGLTFIGDRLYTDIAVADHTPAHSILVFSGETSPEDLASSPIRPDVAVASLEEITALLQREIREGSL